MTVTFHALWMLCALGTAVFAASAAGSVRATAALALGFAGAALLTSGAALPDAVWTGGLTALAVAALLSFGSFDSFRTARTIRMVRTIAFAIGGALAGAWTALLEVQGLPAMVALVVAGALLIGTMRLSQTRPSFAPEELREEGLLAIGVLGLGVAVIPGVLDGWHAAANLSGEPQRSAAAAAIPMWTLAVLLTASSLGALYSLWSRR